MAFITKEETVAKMEARLGFQDAQQRRGIDVLNRMDFVTDDDFLDACARYDLERATPEYRAARAKAAAEYRERQEAADAAHRAEVMEQAMQTVTLDSFEQQQAEARARARVSDALADGEPASNRGVLFDRYLAEEEKAAKRNRANQNAMNQLIREAVMSKNVE